MSWQVPIHLSSFRKIDFSLYGIEIVPSRLYAEEWKGQAKATSDAQRNIVLKLANTNVSVSEFLISTLNPLSIHISKTFYLYTPSLCAIPMYYPARHDHHRAVQEQLNSIAITNTASQSQ